MTIAEKLQTIAENEQKVYDAGYAKGKAEGGGDDHYDLFWDAFQQNGQRSDYTYAFQYWDASIFRPKYDIVCGAGNYATGMFSYFNKADANAEAVDLVTLLGDKKLDTSKATSVTNMFSYANVTRLPVLDFSSAAQMTTPFNQCQRLHTIDKVILKADGSQTVGAICNWCTNLVEIRFEGKIGTNVTFAHSSKLSTLSVLSIVAALKDLTGQTAQTVTFHQTVKTALTDGQKAAIAAKNWVLG